MGPLLTYLFHCAICFDSKVSFCTNIYGKPVPIRTSLWPRNISVYITSKGPFLISMSICSGKKKTRILQPWTSNQEKKQTNKNSELGNLYSFFWTKNNHKFPLENKQPWPLNIEKIIPKFILSPFSIFWNHLLKGPSWVGGTKRTTTRPSLKLTVRPCK